MADGASLQNTITTLAVGSCFGYSMLLQLQTQEHQLGCRISACQNGLPNAHLAPTSLSVICSPSSDFKDSGI